MKDSHDRHRGGGGARGTHLDAPGDALGPRFFSHSIDEQDELFADALSDLPPIAVTVANQRYGDGKSLRDIARWIEAETGLSMAPSTVSRKLAEYDAELPEALRRVLDRHEKKGGAS